MIQRLRRAYRACVLTAAAISGVLLVYIGIATVAGVILRYFFRSPSRFLFESTEMALGVLVFLVLAYTALKGRHVKVEVIPVRFERTNRLLDTWADRATALLAFGFAWIAGLQLMTDLETGIKIGSTTGLPRWVPMLALTIGLILYGIFQLRWTPIEHDNEPGVDDMSESADSAEVRR